MEKKLAEYRATKEHEERITSAKATFRKWFDSALNYDVFRRTSERKLDDSEEDLMKEESEDSTYDEMEVLPDEEIDKLSCVTTKQIITYTIIFIIWAGIFSIFIKCEFGAVFFVCSAIVGICLNTRTYKKRRNEISAYSVFNRNCQSIQGTVKAEDLEKQMIYGRLF